MYLNRQYGLQMFWELKGCQPHLTIINHTRTGYQTRWRTYLKEVWKSGEFFWFMPQLPSVSSKPSRIFRSLSVFTKNSWSWYVNFKYWFPMSSFIELSREAASCLQTHCLQPQINLFEREKAWRQTTADDQMVNSLNFGTDTFSLKWPWFCLLAYLVKVL